MRAKIGLFMIFAAFAVFVGGCYRTQKSPDLGKMQTVELTPTDIKRAELEKQLDKKYSDPTAHYELAQLYRDQAQWEKAEVHYNMALQLNPGYKQAQAAMVKMNLEQNNDAKSALLADIYINQAAGSAEALLMLGRAFQTESLDDYAYDCFNKALMLAPNSAALHKQMGYYYKKKGDMVRAEEAFKRSIQLDPYNAEVAGELGRMGVIVEVPRKQEKTGGKLDEIDKKMDAQQAQQ